jgi:hypothetical protein
MSSSMAPAPLPALPSGPERWGLVLAVVLLVGGGVGAPDLRAQTPADTLSLIERYRTARLRALAQEFLDGRRGLPVQPPRRLSTGADTLLAAPSRTDTARSVAEARPAFPIETVRRVRDLERSWFRRQYQSVEWSFLGSGRRLTFVDTSRTRTLRARLQARFGPPTRTLAELYSNEWVRAPDSTREAPIQFEYWFIVNDSIPVRVSDVGGPRDRGVIVSSDRRYREDLAAIRSALLGPLQAVEPAPYVDYYYEAATRRWYRVGFDGRTFFRERISRFDIVPGRRPQLDSVRTGPSANGAPAPPASPGP